MTKAKNNEGARASELRPFHAARAQFASGADSPSNFLESCLAAIAEYERRIGAFVHLNETGAREAAARATARWKQGKPLSLIDGMPVGIKDIVETIDMPTEMGSPLYKGWESGRDAATVTALREAGAVVIGKTATTEFAATYPAATRNPHDLTRTPGGSSSGSAAGVAAGMISVGLGTQVVGSIIRPASFCGCFGFKPSLGALNRGGSHDALSQSVHGALAASLEDAWEFCWAIAQRAGGDPGFPGLAGPENMPQAKQPLTLAVLETSGWELASEEAKAGFEEVVAHLRAENVAIVSRHNNPLVAEIENELAKARSITDRVNAWESRWPLNTYREKNAAGLSHLMLERLKQAESMTPDAYRRALSERTRIRVAYGRLAAFAEAAITLSAVGAAPVGLESTGNPVFAVAGSALGVPAVSLPLLSGEGLPLGLQVMGFEQQDAALIATAAWIRDYAGNATP
jgi:Asp-tRNA(Asn)/Glu-tRNA(Gln) amidotransferase A subunit family amidase